MLRSQLISNDNVNRSIGLAFPQSKVNLSYKCFKKYPFTRTNLTRNYVRTWRHFQYYKEEEDLTRSPFLCRLEMCYCVLTAVFI